MHDRSLSGVATERTSTRLGLVLGVLSAIGPLAMDLYLPAFPMMVRDLASSPAEVQRTLSVFLLALACAQIPVGSLSDRYGRKLALYCGIGLFVIASVACAVAMRIETLQMLRFVQGVGICAGTVVSRAMIRDVSSGHEAARLMAVSFLVIGISPVLAPLAGQLLLTVMSWRGLFVVLALAGVVSLAVVRFKLTESLPAHRRIPRGTAVWPAYRALLLNRKFILAALVAGLAMTVPYAYITAAPFVFIGRFGLHASQYTVLLGISAVCSIAATQCSPMLMKRWGARRLVMRAGLSGVALIAVLAMVSWAGGFSLMLFQFVSMLLFGLMGLTLTPAAISALDAAKGGGGTAASMLGTLQLAVTALASGAISLFPAYSALPLLLVLGGSFTLIWLLGRGLTEMHARN